MKRQANAHLTFGKSGLRLNFLKGNLPEVLVGKRFAVEFQRKVAGDGVIRLHADLDGSRVGRLQSPQYDRLLLGGDAPLEPCEAVEVFFQQQVGDDGKPFLIADLRRGHFDDLKAPRGVPIRPDLPERAREPVWGVMLPDFRLNVRAESEADARRAFAEDLRERLSREDFDDLLVSWQEEPAHG